jgi:hypothetical protein
MTPSRYVHGEEWARLNKPIQLDHTNTAKLVMWSIDHFNARKPNQLTNAPRRMVAGSHSTAKTASLLTHIDSDKKMTSSLVSIAIDGSWIGYANAMGMVFQETNTPDHRQIVTMGDLYGALKQLPLKDRIAALYFLTRYTRDVLYSQVFWGATHQDAVEDYVMKTMGACCTTKRLDMKAGNKTCVGQMYRHIYNRKKRKLHQAILPPNVTLAVGRHGFPKPTHWKQPKAIYFVHTTVANTSDTAKVESQMVRNLATTSKTTY